MRTWVLAVMTVLVAFAGCLGGGDDEETGPTATETDTATGTTTETQTTSTSTDTGTSEPEENETAENTPPTASISASIEQGQIPFNVTFTLDGADADGDELTWSFDADEDGGVDAEGMELPGEYIHTYESEGLFNATLTISDGMNETKQALTINATAAAAGEGEPYQAVFSEMAVMICMICQEVGSSVSAGFNAGVSGVDSVFWEIPPEAAGIRFEATGDGLDPDVEFLTACSTDAEQTGFFNELDAEESGKVPAGTGCAVMWEWYFPGTTLSLTIG